MTQADDFPTMLDRLIATDRRLHEPIGDIAAFDDYVRYRSERFPTYYFGNALHLIRPGLHDVEEWESLARAHFPRDQYRHFAFTYMRDAATDRLAGAMRERGYDVDLQVWMVAPSSDTWPDIPEGLEIRRVVDHADVRELYRAQGYSIARLNDRGRFDSLFEKTMFVSTAIGISWFGLARRGDPGLLSSLGIFSHRGVSRLQDVMTPEEFRGNGYASLLLRVARAVARKEHGNSHVGLCAASDAVRLYRRLGWREVAEEVEAYRVEDFATSA